MQLLAVNVYEPFGTIILSSYHFKVADEHAAKDNTFVYSRILMTRKTFLTHILFHLTESYVL